MANPLENLKIGDRVKIVHFGNQKKVYTDEEGLAFEDDMPHLVGLEATVAEISKIKPYMYALNKVPKYAWYYREQLEKLD